MTPITIKNIVRSRRRTISLLINSDATLTIKAPWFTPMSYINKLIKEKEDWIRKSIIQIQSKPKAFKHEFVEGEEFLFLGNIYKLKIVHSPFIEVKDYLIFPKSKLEKAKINLTEWYKKQALLNIKSRTDYFAKKMGLKYGTLRLSTATSRWGSCSGEDNLRFNWKLIMAPQEVIDYVVVHELAHVVHKNHSQRFWMYVRNFIPDCNRRKKWLHTNSNRMTI